MKTPIWVYVVVVLLSAGAGVAIAGIPDTSPREPTIVPPVTTEAPDPLLELEETAAVEPEPEPVEATTTAPTTTIAPETTTSTTTTTLPPLPERGDVEITVANGADIGGIAGRTSDRLGELGYANTLSRDGADIVNQTFIYAPSELTEFGERLASDLGLPGGRVRALSQSPEVLSGDEPEFVLYLGTDIELVVG